MWCWCMTNDSEAWNQAFTVILVFLTLYTVFKDIVKNPFSSLTEVFYVIGLPIILTVVFIWLISYFIKRKKKSILQRVTAKL